MRVVALSLDREIQVGNGKVQKILEIKFRDMEKMVVSMGEGMIELGML